MAKILLTSIGSLSADIVIKSLKRQDHFIVGCDIYPKVWIADAYNVSHFYQAPYVKYTDKYIDFITHICKLHNIEYIIPLIDPEVDLLSSVKEMFQKQGVCVCVSDEATIKLSRNKYKLNQFLLQHGFTNIIPTKILSDDTELKFPVFIKPVTGRSSEGCRMINSIKEYNLLKELLTQEEYIVQPYIQGKILTVDVLRDPVSDDVVCITRRELLRTQNGAGTTVEIIENSAVEDFCEAVAKAINIVGSVNFELIEIDNGDFFFLEINPRFSGGVEFSCMAGYDVINNHLNCFINKPIEKKTSIRKMIVARKYEEYLTQYV